MWTCPQSYSAMTSFKLLAFIYLTSANFVETLLSTSGGILKKRYVADWNDLDTRPLPEWYDKAKIGIFVHWGVYSVPSFGQSEWFWKNWKTKEHAENEKYVEFMKKNYPPGFTYQQFAPMFTAEFFNPDAWAQLFAKAGAKYVVLTSKHHEGFTLFPSKSPYSWNSEDVGPRRDIVHDLSIAVKKQNLKFGVYYSLIDWHNQAYNDDKRSNFKNSTYTKTKLWPDIMQLVNDYKPSVIWSDGDFEARDDYWGSQALLAWLYNDSPVKDEVVVNDRWGRDMMAKHGDFYNHGDKFIPGVLLKHKWENSFSIDSESWGYRRTIEMEEVLTFSQLLYQVVSTISCGGNALINVGPTKEGTIIPIFQERLLMLGKWLSVNSEAIYGSSPWYSQNDTLNGDVWYTCQKLIYSIKDPVATPTKVQNVLAVYAIVLKWPKDNLLKLKDALPVKQHTQTFKIEMLGNEGEFLPWAVTNGIVEVHLPNLASVKSKYAWALKFSNI